MTRKINCPKIKWMSDISSNPPKSISNFNIFVILFIIAGLLLYEFWSSGYKFPQPPHNPLIGTTTSSVGEKKESSVAEKATELKTYTNDKLGFTFTYPDSLNLYSQSDEAFLKDFYKKGETVPYLQVFLEESNGPAVSPQQSGQSEIVSQVFSSIPIFQMFGKPNSKLVGYRITVTLTKKTAKESLVSLTESIKAKQCGEVKEGETVGVFDVSVVGVSSKKIVCGAKTTVFVIPDPYSRIRYATILGQLTTKDELRVKAFNDSLETLVSRFQFRASVNDARRLADTQLLRAALEQYFSENNNYPVSLAKLLQKYIVSEPFDPVTHLPYNYIWLNYGKDYKLCADFETSYTEKITVGLNCFSKP